MVKAPRPYLCFYTNLVRLDVSRFFLVLVKHRNRGPGLARKQKRDIHNLQLVQPKIERLPELAFFVHRDDFGVVKKRKVSVFRIVSA